MRSTRANRLDWKLFINLWPLPRNNDCYWQYLPCGRYPTSESDSTKMALRRWLKRNKIIKQFYLLHSFFTWTGNDSRICIFQSLFVTEILISQIWEPVLLIAAIKKFTRKIFRFCDISCIISIWPSDHLYIFEQLLLIMCILLIRFMIDWSVACET